MRYLSLKRKVQSNLLNKFKYMEESSVITRERPKDRIITHSEVIITTTAMKQSMLLNMCMLLFLVVGTNLIAEAKSLSSNYVQIELEEELDPMIIKIVNKQDDKTNKLDKHMGKIDKILKKLDDSYKQQLKDLENLSNIIVMLLSKLYIREDATDSITENIQQRVQENEDNIKTLEKEMALPNQDVDKLKHVQDPESNEEIVEEQYIDTSGVSTSGPWMSKLFPISFNNMKTESLPVGSEESDGYHNEDHSDEDEYLQNLKYKPMNGGLQLIW